MFNGLQIEYLLNVTEHEYAIEIAKDGDFDMGGLVRFSWSAYEGDSNWDQTHANIDLSLDNFTPPYHTFLTMLITRFKTRGDAKNNTTIGYVLSYLQRNLNMPEHDRST